MKIRREDYFVRQTVLKEFGEKGQNQLKKSKVLVVGCGGLGSPTAIYLATSGIGEIHLIDYDNVSISNLHRQVFFKTADVGKPKVEILAREIRERTPFTAVRTMNMAIDKKNVFSVISEMDLVVDCTDNLPVKYLLNDACVLRKKPLVYGSLYKFDGYVASFNQLKSDGTYSCNLRDAFPKIASDIPNCEEAGTLNPIVGIIAMLQANEVLKILSKTGTPIIDELLIYNAKNNSQFKLKLKRQERIDIKSIFNESTYVDSFCENQDKNLLINSEDLKDQMGSEKLRIISVINNRNTIIPFEVHEYLPYANFDIDRFQPEQGKSHVIICNKGITSYTVTQKIKDKFPELSVLSLSGGIENFD